jgi:hypothetical protein
MRSQYLTAERQTLPLWSLDPSYLDGKGLVALWREGLLARKVLLGQTRGYRHHAQLTRFRAREAPIRAIEGYLWRVLDESVRRGYTFARDKLGHRPDTVVLSVTDGQLRYELRHLKRKLRERASAHYRRIASIATPRAHPMLRIERGGARAGSGRDE